MPATLTAAGQVHPRYGPAQVRARIVGERVADPEGPRGSWVPWLRQLRTSPTAPVTAMTTPATHAVHAAARFPVKPNSHGVRTSSTRCR